MSLITYKTPADFRNIILNKWKERLPSVNLSEDGQIYMDADALAEAMYSAWLDAALLAEEAFIPYATGDRLSNLGLERGIPRKLASFATGTAIFSRAALSSTNYPIPAGTQIATQPDTTGVSVGFVTDVSSTIYGTLLEPTNLAVLTSTSGGALAASTDFYYVVTAVDGAGGETMVSNEVNITTGLGALNSNSLTWDAVTNAVEYNVYAGPALGDETFLETVTSASYTHTSGTGNNILQPPVTNGTGTLTAEVAVTAQNAGSDGNVSVGDIQVLVDSPAGVEEVTNTTPFTGGGNTETDDEYRDRIQNIFINGTVQSKTTVSGYEQTALSVATVTTARVDTPVSGAFRNEFNLYITSSDTETGIPSATLITAVQAEVDSDDNRSPNDVITVLAPTPITVNVTAAIIQYDTAYDIDELKATVTQNVKDYINGLATGDTVYAVGIANALHDTDGVLDFEVTDPLSNQVLASSEKGVAGTITITG